MTSKFQVSGSKFEAVVSGYVENLEATPNLKLETWNLELGT
jgi:hypothetical protein